MLERDSVPQAEETHPADSIDQAAWGKGSQVYGGDLFGDAAMPEAWATQAGPTRHCCCHVNVFAN